jgi:hypothetical protein
MLMCIMNRGKFVVSKEKKRCTHGFPLQVYVLVSSITSEKFKNLFLYMARIKVGALQISLATHLQPTGSDLPAPSGESF